VRAGFRKILESEPGLTVVAEAEDRLEAVDAAARSRPDIALMDIRMPRLDRIEATRRIMERAADRPRVLMLTTYGLDEYVYEALRAGASGFLLKDAPPEELVAAVKLVAAGEALLDPSVTRAVIEEFVRRAPLAPNPGTELNELTERELEVLKLLTRGDSNAEIAQILVVSDATAKRTSRTY
jgi:DNA-binding NarL/FixJ family response regulator